MARHHVVAGDELFDIYGSVSSSTCTLDGVASEGEVRENLAFNAHELGEIAKRRFEKAHVVRGRPSEAQALTTSAKPSPVSFDSPLRVTLRSARSRVSGSVSKISPAFLRRVLRTSRAAKSVAFPDM